MYAAIPDGPMNFSGVLWEPCSYLRHQISNLRTYLLVHRIVDEQMLFVDHEVVGIERCIQTPGKLTVGLEIYRLNCTDSP